ncbi:hypothetical protein [Nitrobacter sp.]|uniref:hypothetical protein n=1 Tax=Nitrobacter sp. TaxID=29420 RepID=UPI001D5AD0E8|nr:hypothetical protein [Nitrobacter sp.]MCB1393241.1 hypothetical protein [Nitrobacter sp.]
MKLILDPMPALRRDAKSKVNMHFNNLAQTHRDAAYAMKRATAGAGAPFPDWFMQEAELRRITATALASLILSKPDVLSQRELRRQRVMLTLDNAKTPAEIDALVRDISKQ